MLVFDQKTIEAKSYWLKKLKVEWQESNLPIDFSRLNRETLHRATQQVEVDAESTERLLKVSRGSETLQHVLWMTALNICISLYTRNESLLVATAVSKTSANHEAEAAILPIRSDVTGLTTFRQLLTAMRTELQAAEQHAHYPLAQLVNDLEIRTENNRCPLFDIALVLDSLHDRDVFDAWAPDVLVVVQRRGETLTLEAEYAADLYHPEKIRRFLNHLLNVLQQGLAQGDRPVREMALLTAGERDELRSFNATEAQFPRHMMIHQFFERQAAATPDRIAAVFEAQSMTYARLNEKSNQLARRLRAQGVKADSIVGLLAERSLEMIIAIMAILKAGGAYLPITPEFPEERIRYQLEDSGATLLLTQRKLLDVVSFDGEVIVLDDEALYVGEYHDLEPIHTSDNLAYVIYTSGSTGRPKGVMIEHRSVINRLYWMCPQFDIDDRDVILQKTPFVFDVSVWEMFIWAFIGARVVFLSPGGEKVPDAILEAVEKNGVTSMHFVPSMLSIFLDALADETKRSRLSSLVRVFTSGEALTPKQVSRFTDTIYRHHGTRLINLYGPTETTVDVSYCDCTGWEEPAIVPIGKPIENTQFYVLNAYGQQQPICVPGELYIGGVQVGRGYLNRSELTAERFVDDPFVEGGRLYKTGDLVRWLPDGQAEYLGRLDFQVKIRGYRIELGEIENTILQHPDVKEVIVIDRVDKEGGTYLAAYLIADGVLTAAALRESMAESLPDYMIPSLFVFLEAMPINTNGKLDRKQLPDPLQQLQTETAYLAPETETQQRLAALWSEVLGVESVGRLDHFFHLGGQSLKAATLGGRIYQKMQVNLPLRSLYAAATLEEMAALIETTEREVAARIELLPPASHYELSSVQKRLYALQQVETGSTSYNMTAFVRLDGALDFDRLEAAFCALCARHESLRTSFGLVDGSVMQTIHPAVTFSLWQAEADEADVHALAKSWVQSFDLNSAPLLRAGVIKTAPEQQYLLVDMHHIISDGVSMEILIDEFCALYAGRELEPLRIQYKEYAHWHNRWLESEAFQKQEAFWLDSYATGIPVLQLPTDFSRPAQMDARGDAVHFEISADLLEQVKRFANDRETTLYTALLSAFSLLLSKYARQEDFIIGTPVAGRTHPDAAGLMGMFVNTLALRMQPRAEQTVAEMVQETHDLVLGALEHQDYPFDQLLESLNWKRDSSRNPLFDVTFVLQNTEQGQGAHVMQGVELAPVLLDGQMVKCDLTLSAREQDRKLHLYWEFRTDLFRHETIAAFARHFQELLHAMTEEPDKRLRDLEMATEEDVRVILSDFNDTAYAYDRNRTLQSVFEHQVRRCPNRIAARSGDDVITYAELNAAANRLARKLRMQGVGPDQPVGILMERSLQMIVSILATLKAGGAYLPISPEYPADRIQYLLADSGAQIILTQSHLRHVIPDVDSDVLVVDQMALDSLSGEDVEPLAQPHHLAYVIYTSGSTGRPKGVMIEHRSVINRIEWMVEEYQITEQDVVMQKTPFVFDVSVWEMFIWAFVGAQVFFLQPGGEKEPDVIADAISRAGISVIHFVPSMLNAFLDSMEEAPEKQAMLTSLRRVFASGEALQAKQVNRFNRSIARVSQATLNNLYGPTEATVDVSYFNCVPGADVVSVPIGKPIRNIQLYMVDEAMHLQPVGVPGELCIAGDGLSRGYLNKPELTAEKFVPNPFRAGERIYRTGDLARWLPDGNIEYMGRIDHQVKIRGYRIELGEIEACLLEHETVLEAVVLDRADRDGNKYLAAYVVGDEQFVLSDLRAYLLQKLPDYMVPSYVVPLDAMPVTINGKVDRKALPEPTLSLQPTTSYVEPQTEWEKAIADIFAQVLGVPSVGLQDNFFDLGGHSLKAMQIAARLQERYNVKLEVKDLFVHANVRDLANLLSERVAAGDIASRVPLVKGAVKDVYHMSNAQRRLWFLDQLIEGDTSYIVPFGARIDGEIDIALFERTWDYLFQRHASLRTVFREVAGVPKAVVCPKAVSKPKLYDLRDYDPQAAEAWIRQVTDASQETPFDLANGPLVYLMLFQLADDRLFFFMNMHHIITDGWSNGVLFAEFADVYAALRDGQPIDLPPLPVEYTDYADWEELMQTDIALQQKEQYLLGELQKPLPRLDLPLDYTRFEVQRYKGDAVQFEIDAEQYGRLQELGRKHQASPFMVTLTAYFILLKHLTQADDIIVGFPAAGRVHPDLEKIIGFFVNTLVVRIRFEEVTDLKSLLEAVKEKCLKAYEYQDYPFDLLVKKVNPERELDRAAIFNTMFVMQNFARHQEHRAFEFTSQEISEKTSRFDMTLTASEEEGRLLFSLTYNVELFTEQTARTFAEQYTMILRYLEEALQ